MQPAHSAARPPPPPADPGCTQKTAPPNHPAADPAIIGCFSFKKAVQFFDAIDKMISLNDTVNGEYYVDVAMNHAISADVKVYILGIQQYICWGTPVDYESYVSWLNYYKHEKVFGR